MTAHVPVGVLDLRKESKFRVAVHGLAAPICVSGALTRTAGTAAGGVLHIQLDAESRERLRWRCAAPIAAFVEHCAAWFPGRGFDAEIAETEFRVEPGTELPLGLGVGSRVDAELSAAYFRRRETSHCTWRLYMRVNALVAVRDEVAEARARHAAAAAELNAASEALARAHERYALALAAETDAAGAYFIALRSAAATDSQRQSDRLSTARWPW